MEERRKAARQGRREPSCQACSCEATARRHRRVQEVVRLIRPTTTRCQGEPSWQPAKEIRSKIKSVENTKQDHQGDGDGRRVEDAQGAGTHARRAAVRRARCASIAANLSQANARVHASRSWSANDGAKAVGFIVDHDRQGPVRRPEHQRAARAHRQAAGARRPRAARSRRWRSATRASAS